MADSFDLEQLEISKGLVNATSAAINFLLVNPTSKYRLDTGQGEQEVTRHNIGTLKSMLDSFRNDVAIYSKRCNTTPTINTPGW